MHKIDWKTLLVTISLSLLFAIPVWAETRYVPYGGSIDLYSEVTNASGTKVPHGQVSGYDSKGKEFKTRIGYEHGSEWTYKDAAGRTIRESETDTIYCSSTQMKKAALDIYKVCYSKITYSNGTSSSWQSNTVKMHLTNITGNVGLTVSSPNYCMVSERLFNVYVCDHPSDMISEWCTSDGKHYKYCTQCGAQTESHTISNSYSSLNDTHHKVTCSVCGTVTNSAEEHSYGISYSGNDGYLYKKCNSCNHVKKVGPISYSIHFAPNGGTGSMPNISMQYGTAKTLPANSFTRTNYDFIGWNTRADGTGTSYANGTSVNNLTTESSGTVTLYAQWKLSVVDITFDCDGGSGGPAGGTKVIGSSYNPGSQPTKTGYTFAGWSNDGTTYAPGEEIVISANDTVFIAVWEENEYTITYNLDGGEWEEGADPVTSRMYTQGVTLPTLQRVYRLGYIFNGWTSGGQRITAVYADTPNNVSVQASWIPLDGRNSGHSPKKKNKISIQ